MVKAPPTALAVVQEELAKMDRALLTALLGCALSQQSLSQGTVVTVDEEGVFHRRPFHQHDFDLAKLKAVHEGTHEQLERAPGSSYRVFYEYDGMRISPWHDIPMRAKGSCTPHPSKPDCVDNQLFHFLCEIPKGETAKFEVHKSYPFNPVAQDHKKGKLRHYKYPVDKPGSLVNYGAIMQTWEDPQLLHPDTEAGGDNDPIDVLQINDKPCKLGEVMPVRVLGTLALVDGGETDWKVIAVDDRDASVANIRDIQDVSASTISELREWFRNYKTAEGKPHNRFGLDEQAMGREYAEQVIEETHASWFRLQLDPEQACPPSVTSGGDSSACLCQFDDDACWVKLRFPHGQGIGGGAHLPGH